jgi:hypothetical protein
MTGLLKKTPISPATQALYSLVASSYPGTVQYLNDFAWVCQAFVPRINTSNCLINAQGRENDSSESRIGRQQPHGQLFKIMSGTFPSSASG